MACKFYAHQSNWLFESQAGKEGQDRVATVLPDDLAKQMILDKQGNQSLQCQLSAGMLDN